jgi:hypothetical protein
VTESRTGRTRRPSQSWLARAALGLYPRAWRDRYGAELQALLDDSQAGLLAIASVAWRALPAWVWPPSQQRDPQARMHATLRTVLPVWAALAGLGLVVAQLSQLQGYRPPGHPIISWSYAVFDPALAVSVLIAAAGGAPLWLLMLRRARREGRRREVAYLLLPILAPVAYLAGLAIAISIAPDTDGVPMFFLGCMLAGFAAAGAASAGPVLALRRLRPRGPAVQLATRAAGLATVAVVIATGASGITAAGLSRWTPGFAAYHEGGVVLGYVAIVLALAAVAAVSAARGYRASSSYCPR